MNPAWTIHTPYRGGVNGMRSNVTHNMLATNSAISTANGQALKKPSSSISKCSRTRGSPDPTATYAAIRTISRMPNFTLFSVRA